MLNQTLALAVFPKTNRWKWMTALLTLAVALSFSARAWAAKIHFPTFANFKVPTHQGPPPQPGTVITHANWQKYKDYMPPTIQQMWGKGFGLFKFPANYSMVVGPTKSLPIPSWFQQATEKYAGQAKLVPLPGGGYTVTNYVTGYPFANLQPNDPLFAPKLFYNFYYKYSPVIEAGEASSVALDKIGDTAKTDTIFENHRLAHVSEPGYPVTSPNSHGVYETQQIEVLYPIESRYTSPLTIIPNDPTKIDQHYIYIPAFRRTLRLSGASRCAPLLGTDLELEDEADGILTVGGLTVAKYLGTASYLTMFDASNVPPATPGMDITPLSIEYKTWGLEPPPIKWPLPGWPTAATGKWQVRKAYVLALTHTPGHPNCYNPRVTYFDAQTDNILFQEEYDSAGRLWKFNPWSYVAQPIPGTKQTYMGSVCGRLLDFYDLQNQHASVGIFFKCGVDKDNPATFLDYRRWSTPAGLDEIVQ